MMNGIGSVTESGVVTPKVTLRRPALEKLKLALSPRYPVSPTVGVSGVS